MPIKVKPGKDPQPPKPTTTTTTTPAPRPFVNVGIPTGTIPTSLKIAYGRGGPWKQVTQDAALHVKWGNWYGVDPAMLMAMEVIESGGNMIPNAGGSGAFGIMQIKASNWDWLAKNLGVSLQTREGQIATAAAILGKEGKGSNPRERFLNSYYPVLDSKGNLCLDCKGEDGATPRQYLADMDALISIINAAANGTTPAVTTTPAPAPQGDVIDLLYGGKPYDISAEYGQLVTWSCPGCYDYFTAYGLDTKHHWAYDVSAAAGDGAPLYAPFDGKVVCAGTDMGPGAWGTGCAAFDRVNNYGGKPAGAGHGRLEIINEAGTASLIIGHALSTRVHVGDHVKRGDYIGQQGGMNGSHVHLEGRYDQGRRIGDPRKLFSGGPITVTPERLPYDWDNDPNTFTVKALKDLKVYQRADPNSPVLDTIPKGDTFTAVAVVPGNDGRPYWLGKLNGRVPVSGTESDQLGRVA